MTNQEQIQFGQWLKERRNALGMTQKGLASCAQCSPKTVEKIEAGERRPSGQIAELLLTCLRVPPESREALMSLARGVPFTAASVMVSPPAAPATVNLPAPLTSFIGRAESIEAVRSLLHRPEVRLVTLTGPPGIGKTRLSLQVGRSLGQEYRDGAFFVPLAVISDPALVASAIARRFGLRESGSGSLSDVLVAYLKTKELLLILDNFEQIVRGAPLITEILSTAPGIKALVTSREALHLYGEHNYVVPPMSVPSAEKSPPGEIEASEAVRLFVERASAVAHGARFDNKSLPVVAAICARLQGVPLAIELAAARAAQMPVTEILAVLGQKLDVLASGPQDLPARQRTLRGAIDWSYTLLDSEEQRLFRALSAFVGGFTLEGAQAVAGPDQNLEDGVNSLAGKSLLGVREPGDRLPASGDEARYSMLEMVREYAWEKLEESGEAEGVLGRYSGFLLGLAEKAEPMLAGPEQAMWLARLSAEHDNMRAALGWLMGRDPEMALRLCRSLANFWYRRGHLSEGRTYLRAALAAADRAPISLRGQALNGAGTLAYAQGDFDEARALYGASLRAHEESGDKKAIAKALNNLGLIASNQGDYDEAHRLYTQSLGISKELEDRSGIALTLNNMMAVALARGDYEAAWVMAEESVKLRRESGDRAGVASSLGNLALVAQALGEIEQAAELQRESLEIRRELGDRHGIAICLLNLGEIARSQGDHNTAERLGTECLAICRELGDKPGIYNALVSLGFVAQERGEINLADSYFGQGLRIAREAGDRRGIGIALVGKALVAGGQAQTQRAARLLGAVDALLEELGSRLYPHEYRDYKRALETIQPAVSPLEWQAAWDEGRLLPLEQAAREDAGSTYPEAH
jgi:predicted ATPase/transcriptional regulator with XRE-family HTH domain